MELLERAAYLDQLGALLGEASAGYRRLVPLAGEAGVGKTALVRQFYRSAAGSVRILQCTCNALSTRNLPLAERQAGWSGLQMAYLTIGYEETRELTRQVAD